MTVRYKGVIVTWIGKGHYGFAKSERLEKDVYLHLNQFVSAIVPRIGLRVSFELRKENQKYAGYNVRVI